MPNLKHAVSSATTNTDTDAVQRGGRGRERERKRGALARERDGIPLDRILLVQAPHLVLDLWIQHRPTRLRPQQFQEFLG
jgi:hypothetical protein